MDQWWHQHSYLSVFMVRKEKQVTQLQNWKSQDTTSYAGFSQKKRAMLSDSWIKEKNMFSGGQKGIEKAEIITNLSNHTEIVWFADPIQNENEHVGPLVYKFSDFTMMPIEHWTNHGIFLRGRPCEATQIINTLEASSAWESHWTVPSSSLTITWAIISIY